MRLVRPDRSLTTPAQPKLSLVRERVTGGPSGAPGFAADGPLATADQWL